MPVRLPLRVADLAAEARRLLLVVESQPAHGAAVAVQGDEAVGGAPHHHAFDRSTTCSTVSPFGITRYTAAWFGSRWICASFGGAARLVAGSLRARRWS